MFTATTHQITVQVTPRYEGEQADAQGLHYVFSYEVEITNGLDYPVQLLRRHWIIVDGDGQSEEVEGDGVIGQQPTLKPGETFKYSSFCPLMTPTGSMRGSYLMLGPSGQEFSIEIPVFILAKPSHYH